MEIKKLVVHRGAFHADDVMCVAMAKMVNPDVEVEHTNQRTLEAEAPKIP